MEQENPKKFFKFNIFVSEQGSTNSHILKQDTCHWQKICDQATQKFNMSLRDVYSKPGSLRVIKNIMKLLRFEHFETKDHRDTYFISEITDCQRLG